MIAIRFVGRRMHYERWWSAVVLQYSFGFCGPNGNFEIGIEYQLNEYCFFIKMKRWKKEVPGLRTDASLQSEKYWIYFTQTKHDDISDFFPIPFPHFALLFCAHFVTVCIAIWHARISFIICSTVCSTACSTRHLQQLLLLMGQSNLYNWIVDSARSKKWSMWFAVTIISVGNRIKCFWLVVPSVFKVFSGLNWKLAHWITK